MYKTKILCSGVALGVYIPALNLYRLLKAKGIEIELVVLENLLFEEKRNKILENKFAFHRNFRLALAGQKMAGDISSKFDNSLVNNLLASWYDEKVKKFIIFSGYWIPIIERYILTYNLKTIKCDLCHMDAVESTSWQNYNHSSSTYNDVWFFNLGQNKVNYFLNINDYRPLNFSERKEKYVIHGGGWGMGTYTKILPELYEKKKFLDIISYEFADIQDYFEFSNYYMIDPKWKAWEKSDFGEYSFAPFTKIVNPSEIKFQVNNNYHDVFDLIRNSYAIISKPGGATLLDSICSATPIILLEPFGDYEKKNSELWQNLGFGITYENWKKSNFSTLLMENLHENLIKARSSAKEFSEFYLKQAISENNYLIS